MDTSHQQNFKGESNSTGRPDGGPYSCTTRTSGSKSSTKTLIEYDFDETLDIKEEIIEVPQTITVQTQNKTYASKFRNVYIRKKDILSVKPKSQTIKKQKIQKSEQENKYKCIKCARTYYSLPSLKRHKKYACGVMPQYSCKLCDKVFKQKRSINSHVDRVHHKISSKKSVAVYKCDKCSRCYNWRENLIRHKHVDHATVKKQFICDYCGYKSKRKCDLIKHVTIRHLEAEIQFMCDYCQYKSNWKSNLVRHITLRHLQASKSRHKCDKCARCFSRLYNLLRHKRLVHLKVNGKFIQPIANTNRA